MRTVQLPGFERPVGAIGFGCASLGSRVSAAQGLKALAQAHAAGVSWFDVAPAYGAGDAEAILGRFMRGRRDSVTVCTKVGLAPPQRNGALKALYAVARPVLGTFKGLRKAFRQMPATRNVSLPLSPQLILDSIESSLRRLGTDHVDVYALHKPAYEDVKRDEILRTLDSLRRAGKVRHVGVAGDLRAAQLALTHPEVYDLVQLADDPLHQPLPLLRGSWSRPTALVSHSVLGIGGTRERLAQALQRAGKPLQQQLAEAGYVGDPDRFLSRLLVERALASNSEGVVLLSMFGNRHRAENLSCAQKPLRFKAVQLVEDILTATEAQP